MISSYGNNHGSEERIVIAWNYCKSQGYSGCQGFLRYYKVSTYPNSPLFRDKPAC